MLHMWHQLHIFKQYGGSLVTNLQIMKFQEHRSDSANGLQQLMLSRVVRVDPTYPEYCILILGFALARLHATISPGVVHILTGAVHILTCTMGRPLIEISINRTTLQCIRYATDQKMYLSVTQQYYLPEWENQLQLRKHFLKTYQVCLSVFVLLRLYKTQKVTVL